LLGYLQRPLPLQCRSRLLTYSLDQYTWPTCDHRRIKAYSEDLRNKVVQAVHQRGISKSHTARLCGISLSSVECYVRLADQGESLVPKKGGGRSPKPTRLQRGSSNRTYVEGRR
jgi:transposase-like protein